MCIFCCTFAVKYSTIKNKPYEKQNFLIAALRIGSVCYDC